MKNLKHVFAFMLLFLSLSIMAQDEENSDSAGEGEDMDTSKPTNFYSFIDNTLEVAIHSNQNVMGYRGKLTLAISPENLVLVEVPLLYNDRTDKFGLGDLRVRYFWLPYKNYENVFGAFGPSIDIFVPSGSFNNGLGSGRFIVSPGITVGLMVAEWIQFFPILSYQYASKPVYSNPTPATDMDSHGLSFQVLTPIIFSDVFFVQVTPIYKMNNFTDERADRFEQEVFLSYTLNPKMQLTAFYNGKFEDKIHTISAGLSIFF